MKKEIFYILKRVIIGVLIAIVLFAIKSCQVKALTNDGVVSGLTIPASSSEARFFSLNTNGTFNEKGYTLLTSGDILYALPSTPNYTYGTGGGALSICNLSLVNNYYYGVTYYFASAVSSDFVHPYYTSFSNKLAIYSIPTGGTFDFTYVSVSNGVQKGTYPGLTPVGDTIYSYTVIFKANKTDTCLYSAFSSSSKNLSASELAFLGYSIENLGSQALTEQQITNIINNANSQVINNIQNSASSIINNQNQNTQQIISEQQNTTQAIEDLNDSITSEAPPNLSSLNNSAGWLPPGPVDSILNLPLALLNNINTNLSKTCQPVILHIPLVDRDLPIPCITTLYEQMGIMTWVNTIGAIASAFILFSYFVRLYKWVDDTLTFRENNYIDNWGGV